MDIQEFFIKGTGIVKSMKHSPFWEAGSRLASEEIPRLLWNLNAY